MYYPGKTSDMPRLWGWRLRSLSHSGGCTWRPVCCVLLALWWIRCSTRVLAVHSSGAPSLRAMAWTALVSAVMEVARWVLPPEPPCLRPSGNSSTR